MELAASCALLALLTLGWALLGPAAPWGDWRAWAVGVLSQGTGVFGMLILLRKRPHSVCVSLSRAVSLLAGLAAALWLGQHVSGGEWAAAALLVLVLVAG